MPVTRRKFIASIPALIVAAKTLPAAVPDVVIGPARIPITDITTFDPGMVDTYIIGTLRRCDMVFTINWGASDVPSTESAPLPLDG